MPRHVVGIVVLALGAASLLLAAAIYVGLAPIGRRVEQHPPPGGGPARTVVITTDVRPMLAAAALGALLTVAGAVLIWSRSERR